MLWASEVKIHEETIRRAEGVVDQHEYCDTGKELAVSEIRVDCTDRGSVKFEGKYLIHYRITLFQCCHYFRCEV